MRKQTLLIIKSHCVRFPITARKFQGKMMAPYKFGSKLEPGQKALRYKPELPHIERKIRQRSWRQRFNPQTRLIIALASQILRSTKGSLSLASRQELMEKLVAEVRVCRRCRLWKYAKNPVPGEGNLSASLMLIGEAPGFREDAMGRPFVGAAGKILDELLYTINLERDDVYIGNVVKHRPPMNRDSAKDEIGACGPYLDRQIQIIIPKVIVTLGRHSTRYILSKVGTDFKGITEVRGRTYTIDLFGRQVKLIPTFHPAAALYNPRYKSAIEEDLLTAKMELEKISSDI